MADSLRVGGKESYFITAGTAFVKPLLLYLVFFRLKAEVKVLSILLHGILYPRSRHNISLYLRAQFTLHLVIAVYLLLV